MHGRLTRTASRAVAWRKERRPQNGADPIPAPARSRSISITPGASTWATDSCRKMPAAS